MVDGRNIQDNALAAAENLMTGNPDLTAIYATGEPALLGAIAAVESQGRQADVKIYRLGPDRLGDQGDRRRLRRRHHPAGSGRHGRRRRRGAEDAASRAARCEKNIGVPVTLVTKENVEPYRSVFK